MSSHSPEPTRTQKRDTGEAPRASRFRLGLYLWLAGFLGVFSLLPMVARMVGLFAEEAPQLAMPVIQLLSAAQTGLLLLLAVWLGLKFAHRYGLRAPVFSRLAGFEHGPVAYRGIVVSGVIGGIAGGLFLAWISNALMPYMPADYLANADRFILPLYTKILYGGVTEEILMRWGLMSFLVWVLCRLTLVGGTRVPNTVMVLAILATSLLFAAGHLPLADMLSETITPVMLAYVFIANGIFGLIAGILFWKYGLESAILAHALAHVVWVLAG